MFKGNRFRTARLLEGLTLHEVSNGTNPRVSVTQLSLFERDLIILPSDKIEAICKVIDSSRSMDDSTQQGEPDKVSLG